MLRGHPDQRPTPLESILDNVNLYMNEFRLPLMKSHIFDAKGVASQEGFYCSLKININLSTRIMSK